MTCLRMEPAWSQWERSWFVRVRSRSVPSQDDLQMRAFSERTRTGAHAARTAHAEGRGVEPVIRFTKAPLSGVFVFSGAWRTGSASETASGRLLDLERHVPAGLRLVSRNVGQPGEPSERRSHSPVDSAPTTTTGRRDDDDVRSLCAERRSSRNTARASGFGLQNGAASARPSGREPAGWERGP